MVSGKQAIPFMNSDTKQTLLCKLNTHTTTVVIIGIDKGEFVNNVEHRG